MRAQSQPARAAPVSTSAYVHRPDIAGLQDSSLGRRSSASSNSQAEAYSGQMENGYSAASSMYDPVRRPAEYVGYYVGQSPSLSAYTHSTAISPIPSHVGLAIQNGGLSPRLAPKMTRPAGTAQTPPLQTAVPVASSGQQSDPGSASRPSDGNEQDVEQSKQRSGPLIVDGSVNSPRRRRTTLSLHDPEDNVNFSASTSEDLAFDTPSSSDEHSQEAFERLSHVRRSPTGFSDLRKATLATSSSNVVNGQIPPKSTLEKAVGVGSQAARVPELNGFTAIKTINGGAWPLDRKLSSVEEIRTPSPRVETFNPQGSSPPGVNGAAGLADAEERPPPSPLAAWPNGHSGSSGPLPPNANGASGWQTQKKKKNKRKTVKSENDAQPLNRAGGDELPSDESLRKGG
jgi:hypothetical protein